MKNNYPSIIIPDLANAFAWPNQNDPGYLSVPNLVNLFNVYGFNDKYIYPGVGIVTKDETGLSRKRYAYKRLQNLNEGIQIDDALQKYIQAVGKSELIIDRINAIFQKYDIPSPLKSLLKQNSFSEEYNSSNSEMIADNSAEKEMIIAPLITSDSTQDLELNKSYCLDEVFDNIPKNTKVAFISYSWDSIEHKKWVLKLSEELAGYGVYVLLDQYLPGGYDTIRFMKKGLEIADKVIVIGTPNYKRKCSESNSGGVVYEGSIIHDDIYRNIATTKFIPVARDGDFEDCLPILLSTRIGYDFRDDAEHVSKVKELAKEILGINKLNRPPLGSKLKEIMG